MGAGLVGLGHLDVFLGQLAQSFSPFGGKRLSGGGRYSGNQGTFGDSHALRDHRSGRHDRLATDVSSVKNGRIHANEAFVLDYAGMDDRPVTDRDEITDFEGKVVGQVSDHAVLQVRALPDRYEIDIASQDGTVPNARAVPEPDVTDNRCGRGKEDTFAQGRFLIQVGREPMG